MHALKLSFNNYKMNSICEKLTLIIEKYYLKLKQIDDFLFSLKSSPEKWSKKEELGHLIDSAQNNIQRFIRVQYEENVQIIYHPDNWVLMNDYQNVSTKDIIEPWYLLNKQIVAILQKMPATIYETQMSFDKDASVKNTTLFIAEDYVKHMMHHLESILIKKLT